MSDRAPAYRDPALHFDALRLVALSEGDRIDYRERERNAYARTCSRTLSPRSSLLQGQAYSPLPARSANWLDGPCLAFCSMYLGGNS